jgi:hypothetical protein
VSQRGRQRRGRWVRDRDPVRVWCGHLLRAGALAVVVGGGAGCRCGFGRAAVEGGGVGWRRAGFGCRGSRRGR